MRSCHAGTLAQPLSIADFAGEFRTAGRFVTAGRAPDRCAIPRGWARSPAGAAVRRVGVYTGIVALGDDKLDGVLQEATRFFMNDSDPHRAAEALVARLRSLGIDYAIAGALALAYHGHRRVTVDVDVLISREGLERLKERWLGRGYVENFPGSRGLRDTENGVQVDFLIAGEFPGDGKPKPVAFPDPAQARIEGPRFSVIPLETLVELKLASGISNPNRLKDLADIQELIKTAKLPRSLSARLNPYVRARYEELWDIAQAPDPLE